MRFAITSWNVGGCRTITDRGDGQEDLGYFQRRLASAPSDVVCLQETHAYHDGCRRSQAAMLAAKLHYPHFVEQRLSRSHLDPTADLCLAILSRHPLSTATFLPLPTPPLCKRKPDGSLWLLHLKGALSARLTAAVHHLDVICAHAHPFHLFDRDPLEPALAAPREALDRALLALADSPVLAGVDLNHARFDALLPGAAAAGYRSLFDLPTTPNGVQQDHILFSSRGLSPSHWRVVSTAADHHLIRGVFEFAAFPPSAAGVVLGDDAECSATDGASLET